MMEPQMNADGNGKEHRATADARRYTPIRRTTFPSWEDTPKAEAVAVPWCHLRASACIGG